jgi:putative oxidoreductase
MKTFLGFNTPALVRDVVLLATRVLLGVVLIAHGLQKLDQGFGATADGFAAMGIPAAAAAAAFALTAEIGGGALLIVGLLTPVAGVLVALQMAGAFWYAHRGTEILAMNGGWELVAVIGLLGLTLAVTGAGRISLDRLLLGSKAQASTPERETVRV